MGRAADRSDVRRDGRVRAGDPARSPRHGPVGPAAEPPTLEQQVDDLRAVLEAVDADRVSIIGGSDLGLSALFAATYPERVNALVLAGVAADGAHTLVGRARQEMLEAIESWWGDGALVSLFAPSQMGNRDFVEWWGRMQRSAVSPGMARKLMEMTARTNLRAVLPTIRVPTLVLHRTGDRVVPVECGREVAELIPGAAFIERRGRGRLRLDRPHLAVRRRGVFDRRALDAPDQPSAIHGAVHRHRRVDRAALEAGRRPLALAARGSRPDRARRAAPLARTRGQDGRRRLSGHLRRSGAGGQLRRRDRRTASSRWGSRCAPGCTPASARCGPMTCPGSPSTSPPG